jgi:hypothetical protein
MLPAWPFYVCAALNLALLGSHGVGLWRWGSGDVHLWGVLLHAALGVLLWRLDRTGRGR